MPSDVKIRQKVSFFSNYSAYDQNGQHVIEYIRVRKSNRTKSWKTPHIHEVHSQEVPSCMNFILTYVFIAYTSA